MGHTVLESLVEGRGGRGAMRCRGRYLHEREVRVDERSGVFDTLKLGKAEAFGDTLFTAKETSMRCEHRSYEGASKCLYSYLG